jgi:hypothetical protein
MAQIVVVSMNASGEEQHDSLEGDIWEVPDGVLLVLDGVGHVVASYAAGKWLNVVKRWRSSSTPACSVDPYGNGLPTRRPTTASGVALSSRNRRPVTRSRRTTRTMSPGAGTRGVGAM